MTNIDWCARITIPVMDIPGQEMAKRKAILPQEAIPQGDPRKEMDGQKERNRAKRKRFEMCIKRNRSNFHAGVYDHAK